MRYKIKLGEHITGTIWLGYQNENEVREIEFDPSIWAERYGEGALSLSVQRNGDTDPYPKTLTDNVWTVEAVDVEKNGFGYCQVMYVAGTKVKASAVFKFFVEKSLDATGDLPDPYISYFEQIIETGAQVTADANRAEAAADSIKDLTATANTLPAGSDASASYGAETGVMSFGIPKGDKGDTGEQGETGETGNGIQSTVLNADYTLTITFTDGTTYTTPSIRGAQGEQGVQGETGDTGNGIASTVLNADYTLTITFTDGTSYTTPSIRGQQGEQGEQGDPGRVQDVLVNGESVVDGQGNANIDIPVITKTVTGNPIVVDDADGAVQALNVELLPVQDLHGYDKPWAAGAGTNKFNKATITDNAYINGIGEIATGQTEFFCSDYIPISPSTAYYSNADVNGRIYTHIFFDADKNYVDKNATSRAVFTSPANAYYVRVNAIKSNITADALMLNYPSTVTTYSPYTNICPITGRTQTEITDTDGDTQSHTTTVTLPHTVYGADVDVTGGEGSELMGIVDLSTLTWTRTSTATADGSTCYYARVSDMKTDTANTDMVSDRFSLASGIYISTMREGTMLRGSGQIYVAITGDTVEGQLCYPLATPTDLQTTPTDVELYKGDNVVSGDGDMELTYVRNLQKVIDKIEAAL